MELTYLKRLELLSQINKTIQLQEIQFKNDEPFYLVAAELQKFIDLLPNNGCSREFDEKIETDCRAYINEMIIESKKNIPENISKESEKTIYLEHTMTQLKVTPINCLMYIKSAYVRFCPLEMIR